MIGEVYIDDSLTGCSINICASGINHFTNEIRILNFYKSSFSNRWSITISVENSSYMSSYPLVCELINVGGHPKGKFGPLADYEFHSFDYDMLSISTVDNNGLQREHGVTKWESIGFLDHLVSLHKIQGAANPQMNLFNNLIAAKPNTYVSPTGLQYNIGPAQPIQEVKIETVCHCDSWILLHRGCECKPRKK